MQRLFGAYEDSATSRAFMQQLPLELAPATQDLMLGYGGTRGMVQTPVVTPSRAPVTQWGAQIHPYVYGENSYQTLPATSNPNQLAVSGRQWYDYFAQNYGAQNVDWASGSGRTMNWPSELPVPTADRMFRVSPPERSSTFVNELIGAQGPRPQDAIAHHVQFLQLNGVDNGAVNGAWVPAVPHSAGHAYTTPIINSVPYGTEFVIKPNR